LHPSSTQKSIGLPLKFSIFKQSPFFYFALIFSAVLHLLLIIGLRFDINPSKLLEDHMPSLDVVLVNSKTKTAPTQSEILAQANLNRGGNTEADKQMKSALPDVDNKPNQQTDIALKKLSQVAAKTQAEATNKQHQVKALEKEAQSLMKQVQSTHTIEQGQNASVKSHSESSPPPTQKPHLNLADLMDSSAEIAKSEAQIAKQQEDYQKRPKRKSIGIRTQEYKFATYMEAWRLKVEKIGNLNYPEAAKEQKLYGQLQMAVYIKADGSLEKIEIKRSSGSPILDAAAKRIVEMAAPYAPFPEDIRKDVDIIDITRTWTFTKDDSLTTKGSE
jgi:periplasmic protein TonB